MNEWISVKDRLPKGSADVLMYSEDGLIYVGYLSVANQNWYTVSTAGWDQIATDDVLFWMPVPEPPKDGGAK